MKQDRSQKQGASSLFQGTTMGSRIWALAMDNCKLKNIGVQAIKAFNPVPRTTLQTAVTSTTDSW